MPKREDFERYTPEYPLPADLTNMSRQDTVCQFCGVSYFVHNEIKVLEAKCQKLESQLTGKNSREPNLTQKEHTRISDLESTNSINTHKLNEMTRKVQLLQVQLEQSERAHEKTKSTMTKYPPNLQVLHHEMQDIRKQYLLLQDFYSKDIQNWKSYVQTINKTIQKEMQVILGKYTQQINDYRIKNEHDQQQLNEINQSYHDLQTKYKQSQIASNESHTTTQHDLETARAEIKIHQNEVSRLHEQILQHDDTRIQLQNELEQTKHYSHEIERQLFDQNETNKNVNGIIDQYRHQLTTEKDLRSKTDVELETIRSKFLQLTNDYEQLNTMKTEFQTNESNIRRKVDDMNRSRQAVLDRTRDEYEKLLRKYNELDEIYRELASLRDKDTSESKQIRFELAQLRDENIELTRQRETLQISQDVQIKKLHDSYAIKLREVELWPDRLQTELNREREQYRLQIGEIERRMKESFVTELNIEKQKYNGLLRKYEHDCGHSSEKLRQELISTEKVTMEHRRYYTKQIEQLEKEKMNLKKEVDSLRDVLKELHEQLKKYELMNKDRINTLKLKEDLVEKETSLFQAQTTIDELKKDLLQTQEEMMILQETVHRECTEREQLKDALVDARQQLLTLKKNGVLNGPAARSLHTPPIAFEEIEKRVTASLPFSFSQHRLAIPPVTQSEPTAYNSSIPDDATAAVVDQMARPIPLLQDIQNPYRALPPIQSQRQKQRRNKYIILSNKSDQVQQNQRRIVRFIKHMK